MFRYFLKRMGLMLFTFVITVFIYFVFIKLIPDNHIPPLKGSDNAWYENMVRNEGLDKPIIVQFGYFVRNVFTKGSFGFSHLLRRPVEDVYFPKMPASIKINVIPYFLSIPIAIGIGVLAAVKKNTWIDTLISIGIMIFISVPFFVVAVLSQYFFYFELGWAPTPYIGTASEIAQNGIGWGIHSYVLPVTVLTITSIPGLARSVRAELTEQLTQDYILLARAKGLTRNQATYRHALKNAMVPFLPSLFIGVIGIISGGMITEQIFRVDGTGQIYLTAFNDRDYAMLMLITVFSQFLSLIVSILADLSYTLFDPRVRVGGKKVA